MPRWRREVRALAELSQTVAKFSGLFVPGLPYTADALRQAWDEAFGPERLMFGGDWAHQPAGWFLRSDRWTAVRIDLHALRGRARVRAARHGGQGLPARREVPELRPAGGPATWPRATRLPRR
ncbi:amidohydrolase family protein [Arthrobacter rhombi]|uniref:amidohydrolase family protein n=1 Tax=Arthrobacter rhombi TaxID=71253 RepID=UPI003FD67526